jgi:Holliday junction resolvasome RuvABC endonuclease subunit
MTDVYGEKEVAIYCYGNILRGLLETWEPSLVVMEAPYLSRMPAAFKALSEIVSTFTQTVMAWDQTVRVLQFDPATVKKGMGVSGKSGDKELMRTALSTSQLPIYYSGVNIHELDEHSVDAICVGLFVAKDLYR